MYSKILLYNPILDFRPYMFNVTVNFNSKLVAGTSLRSRKRF